MALAFQKTDYPIFLLFPSVLKLALDEERLSTLVIEDRLLYLSLFI